VDDYPKTAYSALPPLFRLKRMTKGFLYRHSGKISFTRSFYLWVNLVGKLTIILACSSPKICVCLMGIPYPWIMFQEKGCDTLFIALIKLNWWPSRWDILFA